ncbi:hypothetical protein AAD018_001465 [Aestuariibius insulae]|uniref:hypothetical protein n=1 Tax=Aestuariibius insulae TaxID=2058287 RepID=UPI00345E27E3
MSDIFNSSSLSFDPASQEIIDEDDPLAIEFALTDRKVSRSQRRPPAMSENEDDIDNGEDELIEDITAAVIDSLETQLDSDQGRENLANDIDGLQSNERNDLETQAIERTLQEFDNANPLISKIIFIERDQRNKIISDSGQERIIELGHSKDSQTFKMKNRDTVLVVAGDLTLSEALNETIDTLILIIEDIAIANGVNTNESNLRYSLERSVALLALDYVLSYNGPKFDFLIIKEEIQSLLKVPLLDLDSH